MLDHKHLIAKGKLQRKLSVEDVTDIISGVGIITTSHIVVHTWDNTLDYQLDVYSCKSFKKEDVDLVLSSYGLIESSAKLFNRSYKIEQLWQKEEDQAKEQQL